MTKRLLAHAIRHIDVPLLLALLSLMLVGLVVLYSASGQDSNMVLRQAMNILVALSVMWAVANVPPRHFARFALPIYATGLLLLIGVALFGEVSHGARRWLHLGVTRIQPSELMKLAIPLMLAWFLEQREKTLSVKDFGVAAALLLLPVGLIVRQPDLGTATLILASGFYVLFLAGLNWRVMLDMLIAGALSAPVLWSTLCQLASRAPDVAAFTELGS